MKKIYLALGLVLGLGLSSCDGFLDKEPSTMIIDDEAITSLPDLQNAVNGVGYLMSQDRMTYGSDFGIFADLRSGWIEIPDDYGQSSPITYYNVTKNDALAQSAYFYFYQALGTVNKTLSYMDQVDAAGDEATKTSLNGQLLAWRAMLHFDLARIFCHIPAAVSDVNAANTGLVLSDQVFPYDYKGTRTTLKQTYDFILKDLNDAIGMLPKAVNNGYFSYYAALALRARVYQYMGEYAKALADAKAVIDSKVFTLYTVDNYSNVWSQRGTSEVIFELLITENFNPQRNSLGYYTDADGYPECAFNTESELFKYLSTTPDDVRSTMIKDQTNSGAPGYYPAKYPGRDGNMYVNNPKILRLSEMYLIAAEAAYYTSGGAAAAGYINTLRSQRIRGYEPVATVTIDDILFEYEKELFAENHIAFAYWRNKKSVFNYVNDEIKCDGNTAIWPIPQSEIDINPSLVQNPGY